jgi:hypothetical protein
MRTTALLLSLLSLGCPPNDADVRDDTDPPGETRDSGETGDTTEPDAVASATNGSFSAAFLVDASGKGEARLGAVEVAGNVASLELSGVPHRGFAYQHHDWQSTGYVLFDLLTVAEDGSNLAVTYLYAQGGGLPYAYTESFEHPMDWEYASGDVSWQEATTDVEVDVPALRALPEPTQTGIEIVGDELWLEGTEGGIVLDGASYELLPFATVDCTECPGGPWYELHALLVADGGACFGIVYLFPDEPSYAQLSYGICLPDLTTPEGSFEVSWSGSLSAARGAIAAGPPVGRPPPVRR